MSEKRIPKNCPAIELLCGGSCQQPGYCEDCPLYKTNDGENCQGCKSNMRGEKDVK